MSSSCTRRLIRSFSPSFLWRRSCTLAISSFFSRSWAAFSLASSCRSFSCTAASMSASCCFLLTPFFLAWSSVLETTLFRTASASLSASLSPCRWMRSSSWRNSFEVLCRRSSSVLLLRTSSSFISSVFVLSFRSEASSSLDSSVLLCSTRAMIWSASLRASSSSFFCSLRSLARSLFFWSFCSAISFMSRSFSSVSFLFRSILSKSSWSFISKFLISVFRLSR
mmetsp:Transcript_44110/g.134319  ORF Transcript_44110/g.134319 Transcript_44110/m.134319 type:complete len:224 (-) Transcript_44110:1077-1748(-)